MKYGKAALAYDQQADLLIERGMTADRSQLIERLQSVNYYRLSGYWHPYLRDGKFVKGADFKDVWLHHLLETIAPQSQWDERLLDLIAEYPVVDLRLMGFPDNWRNAELWKDAKNN